VRLVIELEGGYDSAIVNFWVDTDSHVVEHNGVQLLEVVTLYRDDSKLDGMPIVDFNGQPYKAAYATFDFVYEPEVEAVFSQLKAQGKLSTKWEYAS